MRDHCLEFSKNICVGQHREFEAFELLACFVEEVTRQTRAEGFVPGFLPHMRLALGLTDTEKPKRPTLTVVKGDGAL